MADSTTTPGVELDGVSVSFGDVPALADVRLSIPEGEFFTLVGPSGCGKTTTLRTLAGFETPASGTVRIGGTDVTDQPPEDRDVGIVFQNYALFPHMTVRENVAYGLRYRSPPGDVDGDERVTAMLELVDMAEMRARQPTSLSGGQQQRVALARALAPGPDVLLLDEPLSALDARLRERLRVKIREIQRELDITTVYVTHDQEEALAISDRIAVVNDGRVEQIGTPRDVYHNPATRFVAAFMGENNVFEARVESRDPPRVSVHGTTLPLEASLPDREQVTVCVRPEDVSLGGGDVTLSANVEHVEFLGDASRIHCTWNGQSMLVKGRRVPDGGTVSLGIDAADVTVVGRRES
ncbi:Sulfate transport system ATP-binding protein [Halorhabdus tiamatea SARL4B]|uniref:Molybdate/tungstate import ATP-binding protein WtpC n=1 Tax=Halorhabdus tiamatea SARL4B TaxID=1033806 RepID=F7PQP7_9EURY|nr:ABC transporter ATP-binding protein [Halorhabdus tiamatea]ERJ04720.1 Sulfate transport system ATP-binding protein [Halorhabdus tiamatea SARL4B]CCQ34700.1 putrescine transport ATP-binding protein PotA (TC 3.A.1.11.1) [Halorhabdus tiamatea SARL4B]